MRTAPARPTAIIVGNSSVRLWSIDGAERLRRQLRSLDIPLAAEPDPAHPSSSLMLRGDWLFDERTLRDLAAAPGTILLASSTDSTTVAAHVDATHIPAVRAMLGGAAAPQSLAATVATQTPATLSSAFVGHLLKSAPPVVLPIRAEHAEALERHLFDGSYKGVTDLVTKWVWPPLARRVTKVCAELGISPNAVTGTSLILAILVIILFARGHFAIGLALAWIMTFLDTVDGKLARVTVTSTRFGHFFDHVIDIVHPPLWYLAWGYGAVGPGGVKSLATPMIIILGGYIAGRLIEGAFDTLLGGFSIFVWRPVDSYMRLVIARRNPNLILLSLFALGRLPLGGFNAVAVWTLLSTVFLAVRLAQAAYSRARYGRLRSWIETLADNGVDRPAYARPFEAVSTLPLS